MRYAAFCDHPLDYQLVLVEASNYERAKEKITHMISRMWSKPKLHRAF